MDSDSVRSLTDEQVLKEFGKAMLAHSYGYYDFTDRMEVLRAEALRRMGESKSLKESLGRPLASRGLPFDDADHVDWIYRLSCTDTCAPGRTRTCDQPLRRRLLYPLSYGGSAPTLAKSRRDLGIAKVHADLVSQGSRVLFPATEHAPFDLVAYAAGEFHRLQAKYRSGACAGRQGSVPVPVGGPHRHAHDTAG